jgi:hypothetical protein
LRLCSYAVTTLVQLFEATNGGFRHRFACPATVSTMSFIFKISRTDVIELKTLSADTRICPNGERPASVAIAGVAPATAKAV